MKTVNQKCTQRQRRSSVCTAKSSSRWNYSQMEMGMLGYVQNAESLLIWASKEIRPLSSFGERWSFLLIFDEMFSITWV